MARARSGTSARLNRQRHNGRALADIRLCHAKQRHPRILCPAKRQEVRKRRDVHFRIILRAVVHGHHHRGLKQLSHLQGLSRVDGIIAAHGQQQQIQPADLRPDDPLVAGLEAEPRFYFVHSYHAVLDDPADALMTCDYGYPFPAAVRRGNVWGTQFHPEKSHRFGMCLIGNFVKEA